jgi:hypothetical protein
MHAVLFLLVALKLKMLASELLLQVVEESKLPECSSSHLHHWSPVPMSPSQTGCFKFLCVVKNSKYPFFLHKLHTVTRTAEEGEFYDMENMHTHNNPTATLNKLPHPKPRKEKQKSFSKLYKLQFLMTMETWE